MSFPENYSVHVGAFLAAVSLPGLYLAAVNFHTQLLPTNLIFSLAEAREGVPFPALVEVLLLELSLNCCVEAGLLDAGTHRKYDWHCGGD